MRTSLPWLSAAMVVPIAPPMPAFYNHPQTVDDVVDHIVSRVLDQFGLRTVRVKRWKGMPAARRSLSAATQQCS